MAACNCSSSLLDGQYCAFLPAAMKGRFGDFSSMSVPSWLLESQRAAPAGGRRDITLDNRGIQSFFLNGTTNVSAWVYCVNIPIGVYSKVPLHVLLSPPFLEAFPVPISSQFASADPDAIVASVKSSSRYYRSTNLTLLAAGLPWRGTSFNPSSLASTLDSKFVYSIHGETVPGLDGMLSLVHLFESRWKLLNGSSMNSATAEAFRSWFPAVGIRANGSSFYILGNPFLNYGPVRVSQVFPWADGVFSIDFGVYFQACLPRSCTYTLSKKPSLLEVVQFSIAFAGGAWTALHFVVGVLVARPWTCCQTTCRRGLRRRSLTASTGVTIVNNHVA